MHKTFKFRLYPNEKQEILINKTIGYTRFKKKNGKNSYRTNIINENIRIDKANKRIINFSKRSE